MLGWVLRRDMFVEAYDFEQERETNNGEKLYSTQNVNNEDSLHHLDVNGKLIPISRDDMICKNIEGKLYPIRKELFKTLYDVNSKDENNKYTRKVNGVMCYDPAETDFDEIGNRIVFHTLDGKSFYFDGKVLIEIESDIYLFKDTLGLIYSIGKSLARKLYIINE